MSIEGGCYCGNVRYTIDSEFVFKGECCCRECQYISGGNPNLVVGVSRDAFRITEGEPKPFRRKDLDNPVTREFCPDCGTHLLTRAPSLPDIVIVKVGTLDDPSLYGGPDYVIWTHDAQPFHLLPEGVEKFEKFRHS